jgi:uncharacterized protein YbbC (DUF1343 family)
MTGWHRDEWFDATGLPWVDPSPNIRNLNEALLYPGVGMLEYSTNYSVGRGTAKPFEQVGADWIQGPDLVNRLTQLQIPAVRFYDARFRPVSSNFSGKTIAGVRFEITNRDLFSASRLGLGIAVSLEALYPKKMGWDVNKDLIGNSKVIHALASGEDVSLAATAGLTEFLELRQKFLLYH